MKFTEGLTIGEKQQMKLDNRPETGPDFWQGTMSDIAFLLIIFFILTALFSTQYILRLMTGNGQNSTVREKELVTVEIAENGTWNINNRRTTKNELMASLDTDKKYRITVHDTRPYQDFITLLDLLHEEHIYQIEIATEE
jgi:biopolymer transport protein ExbD